MPDATIIDIFNAQAAIENDPTTGLVLVDPDYVAVSQLPESLPAHGYPLGFRMPPTGNPNNYTSGKPGLSSTKKPRQYFIHHSATVILVGSMRDNAVGNLDALAAAFILPVYKLYEGHFTLQGTLGGDGPGLQMTNYVMGEFKFFNQQHYGVMLPWEAWQFIAVAVQG